MVVGPGDAEEVAKLDEEGLGVGTLGGAGVGPAGDESENFLTRHGLNGSKGGRGQRAKREDGKARGMDNMDGMDRMDNMDGAAVGRGNQF